MRTQARVFLGLTGLLALTAAAAASVLPGLRLALSAVCHQEHGMALCARCLGLYAGFVLAAAAPVWKRTFWPASVVAVSAILWLCGVQSEPFRFALGIALGWTGASWVFTLMLCPIIVPAEPNCRPMRASATNVESRSEKKTG